jgi:hypothetical protein
VWTTDNDFRIEKSRLPVVLITVDGQRLSGDLFVQASARSRLGYESAPDILNADDAYFPLATLDGNTLLVAKEQVRELLVAREDVEEPEWEIGTAASVEIHLVGGPTHSGTVLIELASARSRVLDYLNRSEQRFLTVYNESGVVLVNRRQIAWVAQVHD